MLVSQIAALLVVAFVAKVFGDALFTEPIGHRLRKAAFPGMALALGAIGLVEYPVVWMRLACAVAAVCGLAWSWLGRSRGSQPVDAGVAD